MSADPSDLQKLVEEMKSKGPITIFGATLGDFGIFRAALTFYQDRMNEMHRADPTRGCKLCADWAEQLLAKTTLNHEPL